MTNLIDSFRIFITFFKIGAFTFGGGFAMIPLIEKEVVIRRGWIKREEFIEMLALAQTMPGPIAMNTAVFVGKKVAGIKGLLFAAMGIVLPSFITILFVVALFSKFKENPGVEKVFKGIRPAVVALIAAPIWRMAKMAGVTIKNVWIPILVVALMWYFGLSPVYIILLGIFYGLIVQYVKIKR